MSLTDLWIFKIVQNKTSSLNDNVVSNIMFHNDDASGQTGQFVYNQQVYNAVDSSCAVVDNIFANYTVHGKFALHGASDCGGNCVVNAQLLIILTTHRELMHNY